MTDPVATTPETVEQPPSEPTADEALVSADLLIEDVSIDGMCGVY